jgi:hypothetical protein
MNRILFVCLFLSLFLIEKTHAQELGSVTGMVKDEMSATPIDFAAVSIYKQGSEVATKNFMTDIEGTFSFTDLTYGVIRLS